ncbi:Protein SAWADEE HOMEOdomain-containing protein [Carex littledalei]|uniref:Protein SAWADEE HOMEOdomain-containing protein n=1 Tax=Carex littledalei TaxID=544730 RepID=A0A833VAY9_9POAL|nr:Protein SAWADEE HOMEOdomain-containing protein [Carex littledalei]
MEVECKRKDGSWHPCQISLSESNDAIIVAYENCGEEEDEEDRIESREEGSSLLRFRSAFLQEGECSQLIEGQCVLALHDASSSHLFFDAIVEKINRVRHSDRLACRCTFSLKWLPNLDDLLEKQVQDISFMVQGADFSKDVMVGLKKASQKGLKNNKRPEVTSGRRVTRSKGKQETEPPLEEAKEKAGSLSFLSPLAARAALASFICTLPISGLPKQSEKLPLSPESSIEEISGFPLLSPLATRDSLASFAGALPASGLSKQAKKPPLTPNRSSYYSDTGKTVSMNPGSEKVDPVIPRRVTRSARALPASKSPGQAKKPHLTPNQSDYNSDTGTRVSIDPGSERVDPVIPRRTTRSAAKSEGVDQMADMQGSQDQKARGAGKGKWEAGNSSFTPDVEDVVTPVKTEKKKRICISPSASAATSASIVTNTISDCEGETCQDAESQTVAKRRKIVSRKPPTRFSPRLAQLDRYISQTNK